MEGRTKILIWGASGHASVVADIVLLSGRFSIVGFIDDRPEQKNREICGAAVIGTRSELEKQFAGGVRHMMMAVGDCGARLRLAEYARGLGFEFITAIHPHSVVSTNTIIKPGAMVAAGAVINPGSSIGEHVIINTSSSVDHDCLIEDGAHIGPGVRLGGGGAIGRGTWVGIGAVVKDHVKIGAGTVIGAGALVLRDVPDGVIAYGVPAEVRRKVQPDG